MAKIQGIIPPQKFEIVRDRIAEILADEILNQYFMTYDPELLAVKVWLERSKPFDAEDVPAINVCLAKGDWGNKDVKAADGTYNYNIDCFTKGKTESTVGGQRGDSLASYRVQKFLGLCRAILENPIYVTLGFNKPFNCRVSVDSMVLGRSNDDDLENLTQGRLIFTVKAPESVWLKTPNLLAGFDTRVKLGLTDKGYVFSGDGLPTPAIDATIITAQSQVIRG